MLATIEHVFDEFKGHSMVETIPEWVVDQHSGPVLLGWAHCNCPAARHGGHRRLDLECCGTILALGCQHQQTPPPCR